MKVEVIPSSWLRKSGTRFGAAVYASGAVALRERLERLRTDALGTLTSGHQGGVYRPPIFGMQFSRNLVASPEHGVPFMTSTAMLLADLTHLPLVSRRVAQSKKFAVLRLRPGMTLISCSGTIGRVVYTRPDMDGIWSSQDIIKVCPDEKRVLPGYLYAYLSSKYGVGILTGGTYGAIIKHIEREHIVDMPVPRLGDPLERETHRLVELAAASRAQAAELLRQSLADVGALLGKGPLSPQNDLVWSAVDSSRVRWRCDAFYHSPRCEAARRAFDTATVPEHRNLGDVAEVFIPGIFKRRYAEDPSFGVPYITGVDVFQLSATSERYLVSRVATENRLEIKKGMILIQEAGQLGGLIGKSVFVGTHLDGFAVSNNMVRVTARDARDAGYVFALLSTPDGVTLVSREAAGSSIPHIDAARLRSLSLPWPSAERRHEIGRVVLKAIELRDAAADAENRARALVERAIEEAA